MKGYKIPEGWAIGWRNAIERYPKDSEYAWGMNAVLESIEAFPLEELDENPWQTGTPTEEGWYVIAYKFQEHLRYTTDYLLDSRWTFNPITIGQKIIKWQKIEEKEDGRTD